MALARHTRCTPRCGLRHDPPPNPHAVPRRFRARVRAGARQCRDHGSQSDGAGWQWAGNGVSESGDESGRTEQAVVLDHDRLSIGYLCGVLPVVQEGAVDEALSWPTKRNLERVELQRQVRMATLRSFNDWK